MMSTLSPRIKALQILKECDIFEPPVNVEEIVLKYGIVLYKKQLPDDISGILDIKNGRKIIIINENHYFKRIRFTIAHELGHFFLHKNEGVHIDKNTFFRDKNSSETLYSIEIQANRFAAELLMPEHMILESLDSIKRKKNIIDIIDSEDDIFSILADKYEVSMTVMSIKFQNLGYTF